MPYQVHPHQADLSLQKLLQSQKQKPLLVEFLLWLADWEFFQELQGPSPRA